MLFEPDNQNSVLIEGVLIGLYEGNSRSKAKREGKSKREELRKRSVREETRVERLIFYTAYLNIKQEKLQSYH